MRTILYTGKGGVGKTSVAAATAVLAADMGYRTVVVSTDIAHSIADSYDVPLGPEPVAVTSNLWGQEIDVLKEMDDHWSTVKEWLSALMRWQGADDVVADEVAILPGMEELVGLLYITRYAEGSDYDLAGFCVGVVEKSEILDGSKVGEGDVLLGIASSGAHSNGYSLIRKILEVSGASLDTAIDGRPLGDALLAPTRIYVKPLLSLIKESGVAVHALSHITGGGLLENIPRVLPDALAARIDVKSWTRPALFDWLQQQGNVAEHEMYRVLNCGIGMVVVVPAEKADQARAHLQAQGETVYRIGEIVSRGEDEEAVVLENLEA